MTKNEAARAVAAISSGTITTITGENRYSRITEIVNGWIESIYVCSAAEFEPCENWQDVLRVMEVIK